jgi:hypothetical protein
LPASSGNRDFRSRYTAPGLEGGSLAGNDISNSLESSWSSSFFEFRPSFLVLEFRFCAVLATSSSNRSQPQLYHSTDAPVIAKGTSMDLHRQSAVIMHASKQRR